MKAIEVLRVCIETRLVTASFPNSSGFDREILPEMGQLGILGATIKGQFGFRMSVVIMLYSCISPCILLCISLYTLVYLLHTLVYLLVYSCTLQYILIYFHMQGMAVLVFLLWHMGLLQGRWRGKG